MRNEVRRRWLQEIRRYWAELMAETGRKQIRPAEAEGDASPPKAAAPETKATEETRPDAAPEDS